MLSLGMSHSEVWGGQKGGRFKRPISPGCYQKAENLASNFSENAKEGGLLC